MRVDIPQLKRCCFCIPLRRGLLTWVYVKLIIAFFLSLFFLDHVINHTKRRMPDTVFASSCVALIAFSLEVIFDILFLISAHMKNFKYLRIYYRYALVMLCIQVISLVAFIGLEIFVIFAQPYVLFIFHYMLEVTFFFIGQTILQVYFVILVRSELLKLENNTPFEFVNHTSEPECKAQIGVV